MVATIAWQDNQLCLNGQIDFNNAAKIYQQGLVYIKQCTHFPIQVNLAQTQQASTLLLAIVIQWLRICPNMQSLKLIAVPEKMQGIIRASNLEHLIV